MTFFCFPLFLLTLFASFFIPSVFLSLSGLCEFLSIPCLCLYFLLLIIYLTQSCNCFIHVSFTFSHSFTVYFLLLFCHCPIPVVLHFLQLVIFLIFLSHFCSLLLGRVLLYIFLLFYVTIHSHMKTYFFFTYTIISKISIQEGHFKEDSWGCNLVKELFPYLSK